MSIKTSQFLTRQIKNHKPGCLRLRTGLRAGVVGPMDIPSYRYGILNRNWLGDMPLPLP
jgi:hypothetical protein